VEQHFRVHGEEDLNDRLVTDVLITDAGHKIKLYGTDILLFENTREVVVEFTPIFGTVIEVHDISMTWSLIRGGIYGPPGFFLLILMVISSMGIYSRKEVEYAFSLSIGSGILLMVVILLMVML
jgi:hypothetical protein